jgi:pimeloyl-ACP methyl ester carboxylesterase
VARLARARGHLGQEPRGGGEILPKLERWLHRIDVPTHIVWGQNDRVIPADYAAVLKAQIKGASLATLPNCAHLPHVEQPQAFAKEVTQFIRRAAP